MITLLSKNLEAELAQKAAKDPEFAARLLENPKETLSQEIGVELPTNLEVSIHKESDKSLHIVLPALDGDRQQPMEIADDDIVAGCTWGASCRTSGPG